MHPLALTGATKVFAAVLLGFGVGFLLVKSGMSRRKVIFNQLRMTDATPLKTILFSITVGSLLYYCVWRLGLVQAHVRPGYFWPIIFGSIITGIGLMVCGQVPATAIASMGEGRMHAVWPLAGMLLAIPLVKGIAGFLSNTVYSWEEPFRFHLCLDECLPIGHTVLWMSAISLILTLFLEFSLSPKNDE